MNNKSEPRLIGEIMMNLPDVDPRSGEISMYNLYLKLIGK